MNPFLEGRKLQKIITSTHCEAFYAEAISTGTKDCFAMSHFTRNDIT